MTTIPPLLVQIEADVSQLKSGLAQAESSIKSLDGSVQKTGGTLSSFGDGIKKLGVTLGATFAVSSIANFFTSAVQGAIEAEAAMSRLRTLLLNTNGATEAQIKVLEAQATALSKVGAASKENILVTQSQLATFDLTGKTINTLTPAILDYVAAEKGAKASTEDYKAMTNGLAQALQGNFQSLTRVGFVLDAETKKKIKSGTESERAAALVDVLSSTYEGFNEKLAQTPEGRMRKLKQEFDDVKQSLGQALLPVLQNVIGFIRESVLPFITKFADGVKKLVTNLTGSGSLAESLKKVKAEVEKFLKPIIDMGKALIGPGSLGERIKEVGDFLKSFFTPILNAYRDALNRVRDAILSQRDRIGELKEKFREIWAWISKYIVPLFQTVLVGAIQAAGTVISAVIRSIGPILSTTLSGIKLLINGIIFIINKLITAYNFMADSMGKKKIGYIEEIGKLQTQAERTMTALDRLEQSGSKTAKTLSTPVDIFDRATGGDPFAGSRDPKSTATTAAEKKRLEKIKDIQKKAKDVAASMRSTLRDAADKAQESLDNRNERMADSMERYNESVKDMNERYQESLTAAEEQAEDARESARKQRMKADESARKANTKRLIDINRDYLARTIELEENLQERLTDIRTNAEKKRQDLTIQASEKQAGIVRQSIDRLRAAFAANTDIDVTEVFGSSRSTTRLMANLRSKLAGAKQLQENAAALAGMGYSQVFIEEVVKNGPQIGNRIAQSLRAASPEATKELQALYGQVTDLSQNGLNALAEQMNKGGKLATSELISAYQDVASDLKVALTEVDKEMTAALAEAQVGYSKAMETAKKARDERLADSLDQLKESLVESSAALDETLMEIEDRLVKARNDAKKRLDKSLQDAQEKLRDALLKAQSDYEDQIDEINKATDKKLDALQKKLKETAALLSDLGAKQQAAEALAATPKGTVQKKSTAPTVLLNQSDSTNPAPTATFNTTINGYNLTSPQNTADTVTGLIKYGQAVLVGGTVVRAPQEMLGGLGMAIK